MVQGQARTLSYLLVLCGVLWPGGTCWAQAGGNPYDNWLNERVKALVAAKINQRSNTNQTEAPSLSGSTTSVADQSSVADLIGVALNLAGLSGTNTEDPQTNSMSVTITPYTLYAAFKQADPLDPRFYLEHQDWRRLSFTLGFDNDEEAGSSGQEDRAKLFGVKYLILNGREASARREELNSIRREFLPQATGRYLDLAEEIEKFIKDKLGEPEVSEIDDPAKFEERINRLSQEELRQIDSMIEQKIDFFVRLTQAGQSVLAAIRRRPQFSVAFFSKTRGAGADEFMGEMIYDQGLRPQLNFTANASFEYKDNKTGDDFRGGRVATQLQWQVTPETRLAGRKPVSFNLAAEAKWMTGMKPQYKGQTKFTIPVLDGVDIPLSLTVANRTELIEENDVRGQFGFSFDVSRLMAALRSRTP